MEYRVELTDRAFADLDAIFVFVRANESPAAFHWFNNLEVIDDVFTQYVAYLHQSHTHVEEIYRLQKDGAFTGAGTPAGRRLVDQQLAAAVIELRDLIYTAWVRSADTTPASASDKVASQRAAQTNRSASNSHIPNKIPLRPSSRLS